MPFDADRIHAQLDETQRSRLRGLTLLTETDSTNRVLTGMPAGERHAYVVIADAQTAGRGRRARRWHSPPGGNLYLSLGWRFEPSPEPVALLPLAAAVIVARQLEAIGLAGVGVKWPNDLQSGGRKLGGILVESSVSRGSRVDAVIGVGINLRMPGGAETDAFIDQPWTDLVSELDTDVDTGLRDRLAGRLIAGFLDGLAEFAASGFAAMQEDWERLDALRGREVVVTTDTARFTGTALGIAESGALRVRTRSDSGETRILEFLAAEVSVRATRSIV